MSAVRFATEWVDRTRQRVLAARSRFSLGLDVLGATNNASGVADGQFFSWLGQFQWVRRWPWRDVQTIFRLDVQLTNTALLSLEQVAVGGRYSVRGYRENLLVRDNALMTSFETRLPLLRNHAWADYLELAPFVDFGRAWNAQPPTLGTENLVSIGIGLRWALTFSSIVQWRPQLEIYWGHPLINVRTSGGDIQDEGIHLQLLVSMF